MVFLAEASSLPKAEEYYAKFKKIVSSQRSYSNDEKIKKGKTKKNEK